MGKKRYPRIVCFNADIDSIFPTPARLAQPYPASPGPDQVINQVATLKLVTELIGNSVQTINQNSSVDTSPGNLGILGFDDLLES